MTELLNCVVPQVKQFPAEEQDAIAELIAEELEEREWDTLLARPDSQRHLARLAAEARREDAAGETLEWGDE